MGVLESLIKSPGTMNTPSIMAIAKYAASTTTVIEVAESVRLGYLHIYFMFLKQT